MEKKRKVKIALIVLITSAISVTICFFCFKQVDQVIFFALLLDLFLLALITIFRGAALDIKVMKLLNEKAKGLRENQDNG